MLLFANAKQAGAISKERRQSILHRTSRNIRSRDSVVGIATSHGLDDGEVEVRVPVGSRIFSSPNRPDRL
jgi:hypothetical protein